MQMVCVVGGFVAFPVTLESYILAVLSINTLQIWYVYIFLLNEN